MAVASSVRLRVILGEDSSQRVILRDGVPHSMSELLEEVQRQCNLPGSFRLQFRDPDFDHEFMNLTSPSDIQDKATVKVVFSPSTHVTLYQDGASSDLKSSQWPSVFDVPRFSYDSELKLQHANTAFKEDGTFLSPDPKLKSSILDGLAEEIVKYKLYPTDSDFEEVAKALIKKHPCLKEQGSVTGCSGWKVSLKYKLGNYRTKLRNVGCMEVTVNSLKHKPQGKSSPAYGVKKPRRAEVNYCPSFPVGETAESLERVRVTLLSEGKKKNNDQTLKVLMDKTFALRRHEVIHESPLIADFKTRWPALFRTTEVSECRCQNKYVSDVAAIQQGIDGTVLGIYATRVEGAEVMDHPADVGVVIEGVVVLEDLASVSLAIALLFGLIYAFNLSYPPKFRYTFEVIQKLFLELDANKLSHKVQALKTKLFSELE
uniref:PB1 domain-containing protein n=1 Tax=Astyanax mexicanus TaxID=7994 RepID=A0A3B1IS49_ASTMX